MSIRCTLFAALAAAAIQAAPVDLLLADYAALPPAAAAALRETADRAFSGAGLEVRWREASQSGATAGVIRVNLLPASKTAGFLDARSGECGRAVPEGRIVWISVPCAERLSRGGNGLARVLGALVAHETGHVLRGDHAHDAAGLMRAHWDKRELAAVLRGESRFADPDRLRAVR